MCFITYRVNIQVLFLFREYSVFPSVYNIHCLSINLPSCLFHLSHLFLQSLPPPSSLQPEAQMSSPSSPPSDLVTEEDSFGQRTVEVAIPNVGTFVIESEEGGYDDEVALAQAVLL